jgi:hypothetical protein
MINNNHHHLPIFDFYFAQLLVDYTNQLQIMSLMLNEVSYHLLFLLNVEILDRFHAENQRFPYHKYIQEITKYYKNIPVNQLLLFTILLME